MENEEKQKTEIGRVLIVEDQAGPLGLLENAVREIFPKYFLNFRAEDTPMLFKNYGLRQTQLTCLASKDYDIARSYNSTKELIGEKNYNLVLLDHRIPIDDLDEPECRGFSKEEMQKFNEAMEIYSDSLRNIGYSLIPEIRARNPNSIIVGTSSLKRELSDFPHPDFNLSKLDAGRDLEKIVQDIVLKGGERK